MKIYVVEKISNLVMDFYFTYIKSFFTVKFVEAVALDWVL